MRSEAFSSDNLVHAVAAEALAPGQAQRRVSGTPEHAHEVVHDDLHKAPIHVPQSPEDQMALQDAEASALMTIRDRIFIAADIKSLDVYKLWNSAVNEYNRDHVYIPFSEKYALINAKIVDAAVEATKPLHVKLWEWPRKRWEWLRKRIS